MSGFLFSVPSGEPVALEPFHYAIIGQTQFSGKCLSGDDLIVCANGELLTVREAFERKILPEVLSLGPGHKLRTDRIIAIEPNGEKEVFLLETRNGQSVKLTSNHPVLTPSGWRRIEELKPGDWIALPRVLPIQGDAEIPDSAVKVIAYMLSEGTLYKNGSPKFTNSDIRIVHDLEKSLAEHGLSLKKVENIDYRVIQIERFKRPFGRRGYWHRFCELYGLKAGKSSEKEIPKVIFRLSKKQVALFLNRYFAGDGVAYFKRCGRYIHPMVGFASTSPKIIMGLRILLLRFGIKTTKHKHELYIATGEDIIKFTDEIGGFCREGLLSDIKNFLVKRKQLGKFDRVPIVTPHFRKHYTGHGYSLNKWYIDGERWNPSRRVLLRVASLTGQTELTLLAESDIWWQKINCIKSLGYEETFDVQVAKYGNLVINGIIVHNTTLIKRLADWAAFQGFTVLVFDTKETEADFQGFGKEVPVVLRETTDSFVLIGLLESMFRRRLTPYYATLSRLTETARGFDDIIRRAKELEASTRSSWLRDACRVLYDLLERLKAETGKVETVQQLRLYPGINRMCINDFSLEAQQLIVKNAFEDALRLYRRNLILVIDEAFKFLPQGYSSAATRAVMNVITQGAKTGLYVWIATQFLAVTDKQPLKACAVKFLGTQDHITEVKHTLELIPEARGRFTADDIMKLKLGHWILVRKQPPFVGMVYSLPVGVPEDVGRKVALGQVSPEYVRDTFLKPKVLEVNDDLWKEKYVQLEKQVERKIQEAREEAYREAMQKLEETKKQRNIKEYQQTIIKLKDEVAKLKAELEEKTKTNAYLAEQIAKFKTFQEALVDIIPAPTLGFKPNKHSEVTVQREVPALTVQIIRKPLVLSINNAQGRLALLYAEGFFDQEERTISAVHKEMIRRGWPKDPRLSGFLDEMCSWGYLHKRRTDRWLYQATIKSTEARDKGLLKEVEVHGE